MAQGICEFMRISEDSGIMSHNEMAWVLFIYLSVFLRGLFKIFFLIWNIPFILGDSNDLHVGLPSWESPSRMFIGSRDLGLSTC